MNKSDAINLEELMKIAFQLMECSKKHCAAQKKKIMANKEMAELYMQYNLEQNLDKKMELFKKLNKKNVVYKYDVCILKNCKETLRGIINIIKLHVDKIPKSNPNYEKVHKIINVLTAMIDSPRQISKKQYVIYEKDMNELMSSIIKK